MHHTLTLINEFVQDHVEWNFNTGLPKIFEPDTPIIDEDVHNKHGRLVVKEAS